MKNTTEYIRHILYSVETDISLSYDDILEKLQKPITRVQLRKIMARLVAEKMLSKVSNGVFKKEPTIKTVVFVYGSLKIGFQNHKILDGTVFQGKAETVRKYAMFNSDVGYFPRLVKTTSSKAKHIHGELFEIHSPALLKKIDYFEGYNYQREQIKVKTSSGTHIVQAYISNNMGVPKDKTFLDRWRMKKVSFNKQEALIRAKEFIDNERRKIASS